MRLPKFLPLSCLALPLLLAQSPPNVAFPGSIAARGVRTTGSVAGNSPDDISPNAWVLQRRIFFAGRAPLGRDI